MKAPQKNKRVFISPLRENVNKSIFRHPVFRDVAEFLPWAEGDQWPDVESLNQSGVALQHAHTGLPLVFAKQTAELLNDGMHYEQRIFQRGLIATRENNWHDLFNAMMWLKYPQIKSALNARQWGDIEKHGLKTRTPSQCAMTLFDEAGAIVAMPEEMLGCWKQHDWHGLFIEHADAWRTGRAQVAVFGHALLDHALVTETLLVAKCIVLEDKSDLTTYLERIGHSIHAGNSLRANSELRTLPLCGIPGWHAASDSAEFISTAACFSPLSAKKKALA
ncbi:MAG: DUF3025 domain-containing protein [Arenimonas sp.]